MIRRPAALLALLVLVAGCSAERSEEPPPQQDETIVTYWDEHPETALDVVTDGTVVLDERHRGSHVFAAQVSSGCGVPGANLGTYQTADVGVPTRLYVMP